MEGSPTYLVTGGAGFIGSHIVRALVARSAFVRVLDNFSTGRHENLAGLPGSVEVVEADIRDSVRVREALRGVRIVFHEAAFVSVPQSLQDPAECLDVNVQGTSVLLNAAREAGVNRVILASSAAVYGASEELPHVETATPETPSPYALSKRINEMFAQLFSQALGLQVVALRYFNVYGSRQREDSMYAAAVPIFIHRMLAGQAAIVYGDGGQTRDLIHVSDVVRANLLAADHPAAAGGVFNICTGIGTRITDVLAGLSPLLPNCGEPEYRPPRPGDVYHSVGSPAKAAQELDFLAEVPLAEGLLETVEWARAL